MKLAYELRGCGFAYGGSEVLRGVTLSAGAGEMISLAGPNGAGKSTLLGILAGLRDDYRGECLLRGKEVRAWKRAEFAREVSFVPQSVRIEFPFTGREVVLMGRAPHASWLGESADDAAAAEEAMRRTHSLEFAARDFRSLSGGERQRVLLAAALAQQPRILLLDEPAAFLDIEHQRLVYRLLRELCEEGLLVAAATHDLNLAAGYSTRLVLLRGGEPAADGTPEEVLRPEILEQVFRVPAVVEQHARRLWVRHDL